MALPSPLHAATQCVTGLLPAFNPTSLTVDCASKRNFRYFRQYSDALGLAGLVSMTFVRGGHGTYSAGNLFLFPWSRRNGPNLPAVMPVNAIQFISANPIPGMTLPPDEYFLRFVLKAPWTSFIGFLVGNPYSTFEARHDWHTNVDKLSDGKGVGICWGSHNLNAPWFGGSKWIPSTDTCGGKAWRNVIVAALEQAAIGRC